MPSTANPRSNIQDLDIEQEDSVRVIIQRLVFISGVSILFWLAFNVFLYTTPFPALPPIQDGQPPEAPAILSVRVGAGILIVHYLSVLCTQTFAASRVIRARLISNTMFGGLLICLCVAVTMVVPLVPPDTVLYLKQAMAIAFHPGFVVANFLLCTLSGFFVYRYREVLIADMTELYWSLGLMFLFGLAIALVTAISSSA
jgi:hypothetical protein